MLRIRRLYSDDRGTSVPELVLAVSLFALLLAAVLATLNSGTKAERMQQSRHDALVELRQGMSRLTKDLRQATFIADGDPVDAARPTSTHTRLDMDTLVNGTTKRVVYEMVGSELIRKVDGSATGTVIVSRLQPTPPHPPFCYSYDSVALTCSDGGAVPSPLTAVRVTLALNPDVFPGAPIRLATDVELRNL